MARPKVPQTKRTYLQARITASEVTEIVLNRLQDIYGNNLTIDDFATQAGQGGYLVIAPGTDNAEIISFTDFTVNDDDTVSIDTGITRGLKATSDFGTGGTARAHSAGTPVIVSNNPNWFETLLDYMDALALAGAPDADETTAGVSEMGTTAEIDADTEEGATTRKLFVNPANLAASKYGTRLPSTTGKAMLDAVTGMVFDYAGASAPTGFLLCDGAAYNNDDYTALVAVLLGYYGYGTGADFTADNATDYLTDTDHGLENGDIVLLEGDDLPNGLTENTVYYVINKTTNTFQLSTSSGGAAVDFSDDGTGTMQYHTQFKVPDLQGAVTIGTGQMVRTFTFEDGDVATGTDIITVDENESLFTGQAVALTTSGTLPTGLSATTYYVIRVSSTTIKLATSVSNANYGTAVDITAAAGGGTHTLTQTMTNRTVGADGGTETNAEVPAHNHTQANGTTGSANGGGGGVATGTAQVTTTGGTAPNNMPPFVALSKVIKT